MASIDELKQEIQTATQRLVQLRRRSSELPTRKRMVAQELAGMSDKSERKIKKEELDDLATDEIVLPLQIEGAQFSLEETEKTLLLAEMEELHEQAKPLSEAGFEARAKREYWYEIERKSLAKSDALHNQADRKQMNAAELGRQIAKRRKQATEREEQAERERQGLQPRVMPVTRRGEVVFDTLR